MSIPILQINDVTKSIKRTEILHHISLEINVGEIVGLLGPNGSGKTTLIKTVVGLLRADDGTIYINGKNIQTEFSEAIGEIGAIVENPEFYDYMTGYQNLQHYANMYNLTDERVNEVVELVQLDYAIHKKVSTYSLGMRQRLGIAQAILHKPKLLILDEPTNGLDPAGMKDLRDYVQKLRDEENVAIIIATHQLREIEDVCDKVVIMRNGELIAVNDMRKICGEVIAVAFTVDNLEKAIQVLQDFFPVVEGTKIKITIPHEQIPLANEQLVKNDVCVYEITHIVKTLEQSFYEVTEEGRK